MKKIFFGLILILLGVFAHAQNGLENLIVETYYISNANDAAGSVGTLPVGSVTYRFYVDMLPGYKFEMAYGNSIHPLLFNTTTSFFNNEDRGATTPTYTKTQASHNTVMLDSWLSVGAACVGNFAVLKSEDNGVNNVVNTLGILANTEINMGIPLTTQDGLLAGSPQSVTFVGIDPMTDLAPIDALSLVGSSFSTSDGAWASLNGSVGPTASNRVLIAQITTDGALHYELNIQIGTPSGDIEVYVASNPQTPNINGVNEIYMPSLSGTLNNHTIATGNTSISACVSPVSGAAINVPYTSVGTYFNGNIYTAQLSDASGSFAAPVNIGSLTSIADTGTIAAIIPAGTPSGTGYRIRVVSGSPHVYATDNGSDITIFLKPTVTLGTFTDKCIDAPSFALTGGTPVGGVYSGTGVNAGNFNPALAGVGVHNIIYSYTDGNSCSNSDTSTITVHALPVVDVTPFSPVCQGASAFTLTHGTPAGGTYSGTGVSGGSFDPTIAGLGTHLITYNYTDGFGCSNSDTASITVMTNITVTLAPLSSTCINASPFALTGGTPAGGVYSGTGVSGGNFNPATAGLGTFTITYTYTSGICTNFDTKTITVNNIPTVTQTAFSDVCSNTPLFALTGGSPAGGTYSGTGVSGGNFNPATSGAGAFPITYTYTDGNSCTASDSKTITVLSSPVVTLTMPDTFQCVNYPSVTLAGNPTGGTFAGAGITGNQFNPATAGVGPHLLTYTYVNGSNCAATDSLIAFVDLCTGIDQPLATSDLISIVPNPNAGTFTIINPNAPNGSTFEIYNVLGKVVYSKQIMKYSQTIDLTGMSGGVYFMTCTQNNGRITKKIVVSR